MGSSFIAVTAVAANVLGIEQGGDRIVGGADKSRAGCAVVHRGFTGAGELGLGRFGSRLIVRPVCPERDASDIVAFPVTQSTKRKTGHTNGFVSMRPTQQNKNHSRILNVVNQDFQKP